MKGLKTMLERDLIELFKRSARGTPAFAVKKKHGSGFSGDEPDLTGCFDGFRFELEAKIDPNIPTLGQQKALVSWGKAGAFVGVLIYVRETNQVWVLPAWDVGLRNMGPFKQWGRDVFNAGILLDWRKDEPKRLDMQPLLKAIREHCK